MRPIPGYPGYYATGAGRILSDRTGSCKALALRLHHGYPRVNVRTGKGRRFQRVESVHKLVLLAFKGLCPAGQECRHLNGNPLDNRIENLCWGTPSENARDSVRHGTCAGSRVGEDHGCTKLTEDEVLTIHRLANTGVRQVVLASTYGVTQRHVSSIKLGQTWRHLWA